MLGHLLRPWTEDRPSLLDMFEQLDSVQWNSVGIIPIAHVKSDYSVQTGITADNDYLSRLS